MFIACSVTQHGTAEHTSRRDGQRGAEYFGRTGLAAGECELSPRRHPHQQDPIGTMLGLSQLRGALGQGGEEGARAVKQRVVIDDGEDAHCGCGKGRAAQAGMDKP